MTTEPQLPHPSAQAAQQPATPHPAMELCCRQRVALLRPGPLRQRSGMQAQRGVVSPAARARACGAGPAGAWLPGPGLDSRGFCARRAPRPQRIALYPGLHILHACAHRPQAVGSPRTPASHPFFGPTPSNTQHPRHLLSPPQTPGTAVGTTRGASRPYAPLIQHQPSLPPFC